MVMFKATAAKGDVSGELGEQGTLYGFQNITSNDLVCLILLSQMLPMTK